MEITNKRLGIGLGFGKKNCWKMQFTPTLYPIHVLGQILNLN